MIRNIVSSILLLALVGITSCSKTQSYSELLRDEEEAVNWFLAQKNVALEIPSDYKDFVSVETMGEDAPFYKLDADGYVYMQVVKADFSEMVDEGDLVYFRFNRENISYLYQGIESTISGNGDYLANGATSFIYKNTYLSSTTTWGTGIQMPLTYMGYNSEVNLVLRSYYGFTDEQSTCVPYIINLKYFKPEY
ncbi:MAG: DUF4827 family protein [Muribaculaceae bacterium]|nr:DUF4827 family protein [Muribaculaceae bacterium]